jgi:hypothetical protein
MKAGGLTWLRRHAADATTASVITIAAAGHLRYALVDDRYPTSFGLYYGDLGVLYEQLHHLSDLPRVLLALITPGDGYQVFLAGWMALVGRTTGAMVAIDVGWSVTILVLAALLARRSAGPVAGAIAAALCASFPMLMVLGRMHWIHIPETALVLAALLVRAADPALERRRTAVGLVLLGAWVLLLRPTGMIWFGLLGGAMLVDALRAHRQAGAPQPRWHRLGLVGGFWSLAAVPQLIDMVAYLGDKVGRRALYDRIVPPLGDQLMFALGIPVLSVALIGVALALWSRAARGWALLLASLIVPLVMHPLFHVGIDNFIVGAVALAILAGCGFASWPRAGTAVALVIFSVYTVPQWLSTTPWGTPMNGVTGTLQLALRRPVQPRFMDTYMAFEGFGGAEVEALLDATCPAQGAPCTIAADQGLFRPFGEEPGDLELFLTRRDDIRLFAIAAGHGEAVLHDQRVDGLAHFACLGGDQMWRLRRPGSEARFREVVRAQRLRVAWSIAIDRDCSYSWYTPDGRIATPELLP